MAAAEPAPADGVTFGNSESRADNEDRRGFGLYIHWPFCRSKCPYCDFNSHVRAAIDETAWQRALIAELDHFAILAPQRQLTSIFFGGGTPSLMPPALAAALIDRAHRHWPFAADIEITLEANPNAAEAHRFAEFRAAGINRLSLGVQALDAAALAFLGRSHDLAEALTALDLASRHFPRWSFDLIYARPGQSPDAWAAELRRALGFGAGHLSLYQLTIEPGTAFEGALARGDFRLPTEAIQAELFHLTQQIMREAGLPAYEISNHARDGEESRHNLVYWRYGDYIGIGPGAHGRLTQGRDKIATRQHRAPEIWLAQVLAQGHATTRADIVPVGDRLMEMTMMGLRLGEGIPLVRFAAEGGGSQGLPFAPGALDRLITGGFLMLDTEKNRLCATEAGRSCLDAVLAALFA